MFAHIEPIKALYAGLLSAIPEDYTDPLCTFAAQTGRFYDRASPKCLFVGKAVNGWQSDSRDLAVLFDPRSENRIINRDDEIVWVEKNDAGSGYNANRSPFWRVIKRISRELQGKEDWYNYIAWTNLYKISPWEGGNPPAQLQNLQWNMCVQILTEEINTLQPDAVIFFTSGWEQAYLEHRGFDPAKNREKTWAAYKTCYQNKDRICYVQSPHPQGKKEKAHAEAVIDIIKTHVPAEGAAG